MYQVHPNSSGEWILYKVSGLDFDVIGTFPDKQDAEFARECFEKEGRLKYVLVFKDQTGYIGESGAVVKGKVDAKEFDSEQEAINYAKLAHRNKYWSEYDVDIIQK